jgi:hypothetical protein
LLVRRLRTLRGKHYHLPNRREYSFQTQPSVFIYTEDVLRVLHLLFFPGPFSQITITLINNISKHH